MLPSEAAATRVTRGGRGRGDPERGKGCCDEGGEVGRRIVAARGEVERKEVIANTNNSVED
jgi:hypothetical protein